MQYPKPSPSNEYVDVDGTPVPVEDIKPEPPKSSSKTEPQEADK